MEKSSISEHSLSLVNRKNMSLTGVTEVTEFSDAKVSLKTCGGSLCVKGRELTINQLNTDTGTLEIKGEINSVQYTSGNGEGFFSGLFK